MAQRHLIGKQVWEIALGSSRESYAVQQRISDFVWKDLAPALNRMFDRMVEPDQILKLERVELDLGHIDLKDASRPKVIERIVKSLEDYCFRAKILPGDRVIEDVKTSTKTSEIPLSQHYFEIWLHWLKTGTLPPHTLLPESNWIEKVFEAMVLKSQGVDQLHKVLSGHPMRLKRLIFQHSKTDLRSLVELFTGHPQEMLLDVLEEITRLHKEYSGNEISLSYRDIEIEIWMFILSRVIIEQQRQDSEELIAGIFQNLKLSQLVTAVQRMEEEPGGAYPLLIKAFKLASLHDRGKEFSDSLLTEEKGLPVIEKDIAGTELIEEQETPTPQFFNNAGVVLLHPFLKHLFQRLQLLKGESFRNEKSQSKAVLLLQYLAIGDEKVADYGLVLPKFLCGIPANWPMDHTLTLTRKAKQYADELLQAAIEHWGALGSSSADALREGFLIREGKLEQEESGWKLYVEQKAMDVLLDRLPWNLSLIKLPWMKEILKVEWR